MKIKFQKTDFYKCFEFPVKYYLDETKSKSNRTTGQQRGLGSIINDFFLGKLIEIGVARLIEEQTDGKKCGLDFSIHAKGKNHDNDPDIISIADLNGIRAPRLFVEIKNISEGDRFVGLTVEQCNTMLESKIIDRNSEKLFIVYATIMSEDLAKICDVFGAYLKSEIKDSLLEGFAGVDEICLEVQSIINAKELLENGMKFDKGSLFYETDILGEKIDEAKAGKIRGQSYKKLSVKNSKIPIIMMNNYPEPKEFGGFRLEGEVELLVKNNEKSKRVYLNAISDGKITNEALGEFVFKSGEMRELFFTTVGRNPVLSRNNIWVARRNINNFIKNSIEERIKFIADNI
jgi:hypothetical protein